MRSWDSGSYIGVRVIVIPWIGGSFVVIPWIGVRVMIIPWRGGIEEFSTV